MAQVWREAFDPEKHKDHTSSGGWHQGSGAPSEIPSWAYYVRVCGFTFEFTSTDQIRAYLEHYLLPIEPSSREPHFTTTNLSYEKGHWETWSERLPLKLRSKAKRPKVIAALERALREFGGDAVVRQRAG